MNPEISSCLYYNELVGWLKISATDEGITEIEFTDVPSQPSQSASATILKDLITQLDNYFQGVCPTFDIPIHFNQGTTFQQKVWKELLNIRAGETRSYAEIAKAIGNPKAFRAVGSANGKNPVPIIVPCHRVINSDGSLGGYSSGLHIKRALLDHEKRFFTPVSTETEAKLVIVSQNPEKLKAEITGLSSLAQFPLEHAQEITFQDLYFDSPDRGLSKRKWALRLRQYPDCEKIAMKGPALQHDDGSLSRPELETGSDTQALVRISKLAVDIGVNLDVGKLSRNLGAETSLKRMGLEIIQKRNTRRTTRVILDPEKTKPIGELAFDEVSFSAGAQDFKHYEIEIESWEGPEFTLIKDAIQFLKKQFGTSLMAWSIDKLTTVGIICDVFAKGGLQRSSPNESLTRNDYELIISESERSETCADDSCW